MLISLISSFALACVAAAQTPPPNRKGPPAGQFSQPHGHAVGKPTITGKSTTIGHPQGSTTTGHPQGVGKQTRAGKGKPITTPVLPYNATHTTGKSGVPARTPAPAARVTSIPAVTPTRTATPFVGPQGPTGLATPTATPITALSNNNGSAAGGVPTTPNPTITTLSNSNGSAAVGSTPPPVDPKDYGAPPKPNPTTTVLSGGSGSAAAGLASTPTPTPIVVHIQQPATITNPSQPTATPLVVHVTQLPTPNPGATIVPIVPITNMSAQQINVDPTTNQPTPTQTRTPAPIQVTTTGDASKGLDVIPQEGVPTTNFSSGFNSVTATNPNPTPAYSTPPPQLVPEYSVMDPNALNAQFGYKPPPVGTNATISGDLQQQVNTGDTGPNYGALQPDNAPDANQPTTPTPTATPTWK